MLSIIISLSCIFLLLAHGVIIQSGYEHIEEIFGDYGDNLTLSCSNFGENNIIKWEEPGKYSNTVLGNGDLFLHNLRKNDSGTYNCSLANEDEVLASYHVTVRTPPPALNDVIVITGSILAVVRWNLKDNGGYQVTRIVVRYQEENEHEWHYVSRKSITAAQAEIFKLNPNSSYIFEVWAQNRLGDGEVTSIRKKTQHNKQEIELGRHLLQGAESFDARVWLVAVSVVMTTLIILTIGIYCSTYRDCHFSISSHKKHDGEREEDPEKIELIPNVILNPGYMDETVPVKKVTNPGKKNNSNEDDDEDATALYFACLNGAKAIDV